MKKLLTLLFALWATAAPAQNLGQSQSLPYGVTPTYGTAPTAATVTGRYQYVAPHVYIVWLAFHITTVGPMAGTTIFSLPNTIGKPNATTNCAANGLALPGGTVTALPWASVDPASNTVIFIISGGTWLNGDYYITCLYDTQ